MLNIDTLTTDEAGILLEKFASFGDTMRQIPSQLGDASRTAGKAVTDTWNGLHPSVKMGLKGAAAGGVVGALLEAIREKRKKNYARMVGLGAIAGGVLPVVGAGEALTLLKFANMQKQSDVLGMSDTAAYGLAGAGTGALAAAFSAKKRKAMLRRALLGGLAGGAIGTAIPTLVDAAKKYKSYSANVAVRDQLTARAAELQGNVFPTQDQKQELSDTLKKLKDVYGTEGPAKDPLISATQSALNGAGNAVGTTGAAGGGLGLAAGAYSVRRKMTTAGTWQDVVNPEFKADNIAAIISAHPAQNPSRIYENTLNLPPVIDPRTIALPGRNAYSGAPDVIDQAMNAAQIERLKAIEKYDEGRVKHRADMVTGAAADAKAQAAIVALQVKNTAHLPQRVPVATDYTAPGSADSINRQILDQASNARIQARRVHFGGPLPTRLSILGGQVKHVGKFGLGGMITGMAADNLGTPLLRNIFNRPVKPAQSTPPITPLVAPPIKPPVALPPI